MDRDALAVGCFAARRLPNGDWIVILPDDSGGCNKWINRVVEDTIVIHSDKEHKS